MAGIVKKKIVAATLIETLIALVIIMVVFTIAIQIFSNVLATGVSYKKIQVQNQLNILSQEVKTEGFIATENIVIDSVVYTLSAAPSVNPAIMQLKINATIKGSNLGSLTCFYKPKENEAEN